MLGCLALLFTLLLGQIGGQLTDKCCKEKTVAAGPKAGTYSLVTTSDTLPDFCLGGCVYTKDSDTVPGTNYCFQAGQGEVSCSGGGCGGGGEVEGWIEKYFEQQCSTQINAVLFVGVFEDFTFGVRQCGPMGFGPGNVTLELFDKPLCEGKPVQEKLAKNSDERFLIRVENTETWSIRATSEEYETLCQDIGQMVPFNTNGVGIYLTKKMVEKPEIVRTASINFDYDISIELLPDVFVQSTPFQCTNSTFGQFNSRSSNVNKKQQHKNNILDQFKKPIGKTKRKISSAHDSFKGKKRQYGCGGSGWGSGGGGPSACNLKCIPTCHYASWSTEASLFPCECRGVVGAGMNYSNINLPSQATPAGEASLTGRIDWYEDPAIPPGFYPLKYFLVFAEFVRSNSDLRVCDSKLSLTYNSPNKTQQITKDVPCFTKPVPPPTMMPGSEDPATPPAADPVTAGPSDLGSGSSMPWPTSYPHYLTTVDYQDMFTETEGVLIWGGSDRFWIVGCMAESSKDKFITLEVDFFTSKEPSATPDFCGCIVNTMQGEETMAPMGLVRDCYVKAIKDGPAPAPQFPWGRVGNERKMAKARRRKGNIRMKKQANKWKKISPFQQKKGLWKKMSPFKQNKKSLKKMINKRKQKYQPFSGRTKREISDEELFDEEDEGEADDLEYENNSPYEMMNDENNYDDGDEHDMHSGWD